MRVGLVGCGIISRAHLEGWRANAAKASVVATCDTDPERAESAARHAAGARAVTDYHEVLADPGIDAVDLCLPHHLHRQATIEAFEAGKHVLCQKPIATSLADADAMIAAGQAAGRVLMIAEMNRFQPAITQAQALLAEGAIGEVIAGQARSSWYQGGGYLHTPWRFQPELMGGGALIDGGIHHVDVLLALLGRPVLVGCLTHRVRDIFPTEDTGIITARFAGGALGELVVHWSAQHTPGLLFRLSGSEGMLVAEGGSLKLASNRTNGAVTELPLERFDSFGALIGEFVDCVATGRSPRMGGPEGRADLEFVLAAYRSAETRTFVELPLPA